MQDQAVKQQFLEAARAWDLEGFKFVASEVRASSLLNDPAFALEFIDELAKLPKDDRNNKWGWWISTGAYDHLLAKPIVEGIPHGRGPDHDAARIWQLLGWLPDDGLFSMAAEKIKRTYDVRVASQCAMLTVASAIVPGAAPNWPGAPRPWDAEADDSSSLSSLFGGQTFDEFVESSNQDDDLQRALQASEATFAAEQATAASQPATDGSKNVGVATASSTSGPTLIAWNKQIP